MVATEVEHSREEETGHAGELWVFGIKDIGAPPSPLLKHYQPSSPYSTVVFCISDVTVILLGPYPHLPPLGERANVLCSFPS